MSDPFTASARLCDDAGVVSDARVEPGSPGTEFDPELTYRRLLDNLRRHTGLPSYTGPAFQCTGSAHLAGKHFRCTSPIHDAVLVLVVDGTNLVPAVHDDQPATASW